MGEAFDTALRAEGLKIVIQHFFLVPAWGVMPPLRDNTVIKNDEKFFFPFFWLRGKWSGKRIGFNPA